ncbi:hypothetical protein BN1708_017404, partial [Verticillium longisporum]
SKTKPGSSMIHRIFQGKLKVESQAITARADAGDRLRFEDAADVHVAVSRFLLLTLDLPAAPLFQDENNRNIIPQVPLTTILAKYDGRHAQEHLAQRKRYRLLHPLPPYLVMHVKRFSQNKFVSERNPTIVTFDARNLDMAPYVEPNPAEHPPGEPIWYDLVANVVHEAVRARREDVADAVSEERKTWKVQLKDKGRDEWVVCQDLIYPLHLACLFELKMKNALFLVAHDLADHHPEEPCSWLAVGTYYFAIDKIAEARRYFSKASMMDAHFGPAWIGFAHTFAAEGEHDQAISAYSTAARLFMGTHLPQVFLGMQHHALNNMTLAEEFLKTAYGLCKTDPLLLNEMGVVKYHQDKPEEAVRFFLRAIQIAGEIDADPSAWLSARTNLAHAY